MADDVRGRDAHSAEYFGPSRDFWWNADFLQLMARRWELGAVRAALDVGCGVGHWGRLLLPLCAADAVIDGVDPEPAWVAEAAGRAREAGLGARLRYREGRVEALPYADGSFELVTCQTVLIHLADPAAALREMRRVARPGGLIAVAEPHNLAAGLLLDSAARVRSVDEVMALARLEATCQRGKIALGRGDSSVGERLPALFAAAGLQDVRAYMNDRAVPVLPPYEDPAAAALAAEVVDWAGRGFWNTSAAETRRWFEAGGGDPAAFEGLWRVAMDCRARQAAAIGDGTYESGGGTVCYLVSGRVPRAG